MSKNVLVGMVLVLAGCGGRPSLGPQSSCPLLNGEEGFQPVVEGTEAASVIAGPAAVCARNATADVQLTTPDGTKTAAENVELIDAPRFDENFDRRDLRAAAVRFAASQPGVWTITVRWSTGGESKRAVLVVPERRTGPTVLRRFIDRMDNCQRGPFRTSSGSVTCQRQGQIWVYGADGQIQEYFAGEQLAVRGDEIWSWAAGALEHRTAMPGALRLDGSVPLAQMGPEGVTMPGSAIRGDGMRVIEAKWDGATLTSTTIAEGYRFDEQTVITQGTETWTAAGCQIQRGCQIAQCEPVRTCPTFNLGFAIGIEPERVWRFNQADSSFGRILGRLNVSRLPLDLGTGPTSFIDLVFETGSGTNFFGNGLPNTQRVKFQLLTGFVLVPYQQTPATIDFVALKDPGFALTVTEDWMISMTGDPFTLLSTPMPSIP